MADTESTPVRRDSFVAMGCHAEIVVVGGPSVLVEQARRHIEHLERCWTRFSHDSDLSRINRAGGRPVEVDPSTVRLVSAMASGWVATRGAFDPSQLAPLVGLGYAASWRDPSMVTSVAERTFLRTPLDQILVDLDHHVVQAPAGVGLDAGGIGKGLAGDLVVEALVAGGADGALVSIGGDVRVTGRAPHPGGWTIAVAGTTDVSRDEQVHLLSGAVATSGTQRRAWIDAAGDPRHHLLDPATSRPIATSRAAVPLVEATVIAGTGAWAEVWTKAVVVRGPDAVFPDLAERGLACRVVFADGSVEHNEAWREFQGHVEEVR